MRQEYRAALVGACVRIQACASWYIINLLNGLRLGQGGIIYKVDEYILLGTVVPFEYITIYYDFANGLVAMVEGGAGVGFQIPNDTRSFLQGNIVLAELVERYWLRSSFSNTSLMGLCMYMPLVCGISSAANSSITACSKVSSVNFIS